MHRLVTYLLLCLATFACGSEKKDPPRVAAPDTGPSGLVPQGDIVPPLPAGPPVVLSEQQGRVEVKRDGEWAPARVGATLQLRDGVRTQDQSTVKLELGDVTVTLQPKSEVTVQEVTHELAKLRLEHGLVAAKVEGGGKQGLQVRATGSSALAETSEGEFTVFNDGKGLVAVAPTVGEVRLTSTGGDALLAVGQRGSVSDNGAPIVAQVPRKVLLSVNWPKEELSRPHTVVLKGVVESSTRLAINGLPVTVKQDGSFETEVIVKRGKNPVKFEARDLTGRKTSKAGTIDVAPLPPGATANSKGIWK